MDKYFYLAAELPFLQFKTAPVSGQEEFLSEAGKWMSGRELKSLSKADLNSLIPDHSAPLIFREYQQFEIELRRRTAVLRRREKEGNEPKVSDRLDQVLSEGNPLDKEIGLLKLRWDFLEDLEQGHYFDLEFLIVYYLKLQVLTRVFTFDKEQGTKVFDSVCEVKHG